MKFRADPTPTYDPQTVLNPGPEISGVSETLVYEKASSASDPVLKPAGYVSGIKGEVSAVFRTDCEKTVYLRAVGPDGYELPWKQAQVLPDGKIAYPRTKLSKTFPSEVVQYYYRFKLDWYASTSPNPGVGEARLIDFSFNPLYVLHDVPRDGHELFYEHSLVDLACRNAAGADDEPEIIEAIYEQFEPRQVKRYDSDQAMKYWGGNNPEQGGAAEELCFTYQGLFAYDDATCGAWADLFYNLLKVQGLKEGSVTQQSSFSELPNPSMVQPNYPLSFGSSAILLTGANNPELANYIATSTLAEIENSITELLNGIPTSSGLEVQPIFQNAVPPEGPIQYLRVWFLVKNWDLTNLPEHNIMRSETRVSFDPLVTIDKPASFEPPESIVLSNGQVIPYLGLPGAPGQNQPNPRAEFTNHAVYSYQGKVYDPSYGTPLLDATSQNEWENNSLAGFGIRLLVLIPSQFNSSNMDVETLCFYLIEENHSEEQTKFIELISN